jgi:hypothetical protein
MANPINQLALTLLSAGWYFVWFSPSIACIPRKVQNGISLFPLQRDGDILDFDWRYVVPTVRHVPDGTVPDDET